MKVRQAEGGRITTNSLIAIFGLCVALLPEQAFAKAKSNGRSMDKPMESTGPSGSLSVQGRAKKGRGKHRGAGGATRDARGGAKISARTGAKARRFARPDKNACAGFYKEAIEQIHGSHLREARDLSVKCGQPTCGRLVKPKCRTLYTYIEADIPSIVLVLTDASADAASQVEVRMDGEVLAPKIDGQPIFVDPGNHQFTFRTEKGVFATQDTLIVRGQRNRTISVSLRKGKAALAKGIAANTAAPKGEGAEHQAVASEEAPRKLPAAIDPEAGSIASQPADLEESEPAAVTRTAAGWRGLPWPVYGLGGVGVLGVGGYMALTLKGRQDNSTLQSSCSPNCQPSSLHYIRTLYLAADISLGVGVVALAASTWLYFRSRDTEDRASRDVAISTLDVQPIQSGALATIGGRF